MQQFRARAVPSATTRSSEFLISEAIHRMIVCHAGRLHMSIHDGRPHNLKPRFLRSWLIASDKAGEIVKRSCGADAEPRRTRRMGRVLGLECSPQKPIRRGGLPPAASRCVTPSALRLSVMNRAGTQPCPEASGGETSRKPSTNMRTCRRQLSRDAYGDSRIGYLPWTEVNWLALQTIN
jgi:hypothetical protein